jgi:hypothetical protein
LSSTTDEAHFPGFGAAVRSAAAFPLDQGLVTSCLDASKRPNDGLFARALEGSIRVLTAKERAALAPTTGHVAESVAELILGQLGFTVFGDQTGPGGHGVDLLVLDASQSRVFAVEVKGTLQARRWPRLSRGTLAQMTAGWLDNTDNPGMSGWELTSAAIYGAVLLISFPQTSYKLLLTTDFERLWPVLEDTDLADLGWLEEATGISF